MSNSFIHRCSGIMNIKLKHLRGALKKLIQFIYLEIYSFLYFTFRIFNFVNIIIFVSNYCVTAQNAPSFSSIFPHFTQFCSHIFCLDQNTRKARNFILAALHTVCSQCRSKWEHYVKENVTIVAEYRFLDSYMFSQRYKVSLEERRETPFHICRFNRDVVV